MMQNSRNAYIIFKLNKIYLHSRHYFTSSNCIFMQLQGIVFIQLQGNDILLNCQGNIDFFQITHIHSQKYNHSRQLYSDTKLYSFQGSVSVRSSKYILVERNIFIQGNYIHSRKYIYLRNIYIRSSSRPYFHSRKLYLTLLHSRNSRNIYSKIVPSHFMIIINFTIAIS